MLLSQLSQLSQSPLTMAVFCALMLAVALLSQGHVPVLVTVGVEGLFDRFSTGFRIRSFPLLRGYRGAGGGTP